VGGFPLVCLLFHLGQLVLGEEGRVLGILHQGVLHLGILLQGVLYLGILLAVLPGEVLPIRMGSLEVRFFPHVYLVDLLGLVLLLNIGLRRHH
jgi:hypothetical protein